jgi:hypothetical protein
MVGRPRDLDAYETLVREHQLIAFRTADVITGSAADAVVPRALGSSKPRRDSPVTPWSGGAAG